MALRNKKILITAGPTWVPLDKVRVISNMATAETGILLAEKLQRDGAQVTLLLGPVQVCCLNKKITLIHFRFFSELRCVLKKELVSKKFDIVIHSAAVADYQPLKFCIHKIKSGIKKLRLTFVPTEKLINLIKKIDNSVFLVGFKFEPEISKDVLLKEAGLLFKRARADLVVANTVTHNRYRAYILNNKDETFGPVVSKEQLVRQLVDKIAEQS